MLISSLLTSLSLNQIRIILFSEFNQFIRFATINSFFIKKVIILQIIPKNSVFAHLKFNGADNFLLGATFGFIAYIVLYAIVVLIFKKVLHKPLSSKGITYLSASTASIGLTILLGFWLSSATFSTIVSLISFAALLMPWAHKLHL